MIGMKFLTTAIVAARITGVKGAGHDEDASANPDYVDMENKAIDFFVEKTNPKLVLMILSSFQVSSSSFSFCLGVPRRQGGIGFPCGSTAGGLEDPPTNSGHSFPQWPSLPHTRQR